MFVNVSDTLGPTFINFTNIIIGQYDSLTYLVNATDASNVSCFTVNDSRFEIDCSGNLINITELTDYYYLFNITVNDTYNNINSQVISVTRSSVARINLDVIYPTGNINVNQSEWFNVSVNVSCYDAYCGDINVSLDPATDRTMRTCSGVWGASCTGSDPLVSQYSYDSCSSGEYYSDGFWVNEVYVDATTVAIGDTINITCNFNCYSTSSYNTLAISYYNGTWNQIWLQGSSCIDGNYSKTVVVSGSIGTQKARCQIGYDEVTTPTGTCFTTQYSDNDDVNFTVIAAGKSGLVSMNTSATPFYTNVTNPYTANLNHGQSQIITWTVNATGTSTTPYTFFAYANMTSNMSIGNITSNWNVTINDIVAPVFTNISNKSLEYKTALSHTINASDSFGISCYSVNDTTNFTISCAGVLTNKTLLAVGLYNLNITVNDTSNNIVSGVMWVNVSDTIIPVINIVYPVNNTNYIVNVSALNYTATDSSTFSGCWWSNSSGVWNSTTQTAGTNWTGLTSVEGWNNWTVYCNDTYNNLGSKMNRFFKDTILPAFNNLINQSTTEVLGVGYQINATDSNGISCFTVNDTTRFNINCSGYLKNNTILSGGLYNLNITINDTYNNRNSVLMFVNVSDTNSPIFVNLTNQTLYQDVAFNYQINATDISGVSCFSVNDTTNFNINCSGYLKNNTYLNVGLYNLNITVNDSSNNKNYALMWVNVTLIPRIGLTLITPTGNINVTQNKTFEVSVNISCSNTDCGEINVTLDPSSTVYNLTTCGASGRLGPTQSNCTANYTGTALAGLVTINTQGYQEFIVPATGVYLITAYGASGGTQPEYSSSVGYGASISGNLTLTAGTRLIIAVGQRGGNGLVSDNEGGGGGGTFVAYGDSYNTALPLIVAGGASGAGSDVAPGNAYFAINGIGSGCTFGGACSNQNDGAGFYFNNSVSAGPKAFRSGATGGTASSGTNYGDGGFGGGAGGTDEDGAGGGGFTGGVGVDNNADATRGGASFINTSLVTLVQNTSTGYDGHGKVSIQIISINGKAGTVSMNSNATPFYTTTTNPYNLTLNNGQSQIITWTVNATGTIGESYTFFAYANKTSDLSVGNITGTWNVTITNDTGDTPSLSIVYPQNINYTINVSQLNYTVTGNNLSSCWYSTNSGQTNSTPISAGTNFTQVTSAEGTNTWFVYCNNSINNNTGSISIIFYKDSVSPNVTLNSPADNYTIGTLNSVNITFNCSTVDNLALKNISLYLTNSSNENFVFNRTTNITGTSNNTNWTLNLGIGSYTWNCLAFDSLGNSNFSINRTLTIGFSDSTAPTVNITYPINGTGYSNISALNYTASDDVNVSRCWWSNSSGLWNSTSVSAGVNWTGLISVSGWNNWIVYCNDTSSNLGSKMISFNIDDVSPNVTLNSPTDSYIGAVVGPMNISFNCSATDNLALKNISLYLTNSSNENFMLNRTTNITGTNNNTNWTLTLGAGDYTWNCLAFDSLGNSNWSINRTITLQSNIAPNVTLNSPTNNTLLNRKTSILLNATVSDSNGYLDNFTVWFYGGYANGTYTLINTTYNQTNGTAVTFNWTLGSSGRYNWTMIANDGKANSTISYFYFNLTNFSVSCEAGGNYQQGALVLVQGTIMNESTVVPSYPVNLSIYDSNNNLNASQNLTTASDGGFETSFANLSVGSYVLNATATYRSYTEACTDTFSVGSSVSFVLDKILSVYNITNTTISYNITLRITNKGGSDATSAILTDSDSPNLAYDLGTVSANSTIERSYLKEYTRNSSTYDLNLAIATVNATNSYSGSEVSANSSEITLTIPAAETEQQLTLVKNAYYNSENSTHVNYTLTIDVVNSGGVDLTDISLIDSDLSINTNINLNRTQNYNSSSSIIIDKAASNTNKLFVKATATVNSVSYESNQIQVRIPGYGGPADAIVNAPSSVSASTSFSTTITVENQNLDVGQDFVIDYWITNTNENANYTSGQQTIYVAASGSSDLTATLTSPSTAGDYRFRALVSWAGGTATSYDSFAVTATTETPPAQTPSSGGGGSITGNVIDTIVCNTPYIRYGKECCLDKNNNSICDRDDVVEEIQGINGTAEEGEKIEFRIIQEDSVKNHSLKVIDLKEDRATIKIYSDLTLNGNLSITANAINSENDEITITLYIGEEKKIDLDRDGNYDLMIRLEKIEDKQAHFYLESIKGKIEIEKPEILEEEKPEKINVIPYSKIWIILLSIFLILMIIIVAKKVKISNLINSKRITDFYSAVGGWLVSKIQGISYNLKIKDRDSTRLSNIIGMEVLSSEGNLIGKVKEIYIEDKTPKVYGWLIKVNKNIAKKIGKRFILVKHNAVISIKQIMIVDKKVLEYLDSFDSRKVENMFEIKK